MSGKRKLADVLADCGSQGNGKRKYVKVGVAFEDTDGSRISIKIDALPLPGSGWDGWLNLFEDKFQKSPSPPDDSDIPF